MMANPIDTGKKTPEGRIIWNDGGKDYSERTTTFEIDGKWYAMPTVAEDGSQYTSDQMRKYVAKYGPIDFITGERLPEFKSRTDAEEYAESRSDTRKSFSEGGLTNQSVQSQMTNIFGKQILYPVGDPRTKPKGMGYGKLIVDNIIGLDNEYESFGDVLRSEFKKDKLGFLSNIAKGAVEGTRSFLQKPADQQMNVVKDIAKEIKDSVVRLNTQDLDKRLQNKFGVSYQEATEDQVNKARESVIGDSLIALELTGLTGPAIRGGRATLSSISETIPGSVKAETIGKTKSLFQGDLESFFEKEYKGTPRPAGAQVAGMFGKKKTPVEEYLTPVEVDLEEYKLIDIIDEDAKKNKAFNPRLQNIYNLTYNDVIKENFEPLKFDEPVGRRSVLLDPKVFDTRLKAKVGKAILDKYGSVMQKSEVRNLDLTVKGRETAYKERDEFIKITTDITSNQVKEQFNRFLTEQPGLVLKLSAANKLAKKYKDLDQFTRYEDVSPAEMSMVASKARAANALQTTTIVEILDRFFDETVVYTPDPAGVFKDRDFTFKVTDVDETGAQIERLVSPNFSGAFKDEGWDYGVYEFDEMFGTEALENFYRSPLTRALIMEFDDKIDPKTKVTYVGESRMLDGEALTPAERSPEAFDTEVTFQEIVDSVDKKLGDKEKVIDVNFEQFENLGVEILTDFVNKKTGDGAENLSETVLGADLLKLLENDPRMNVKNIPEFMKTQEFKNRKITLQDVGEKIIDDFDAATFNVRASPLTTPRYANYQLQGTAGFEGGAKDKTYEVPVYSRLGTGERGAGFIAQKEHYGSDALSHVRFSVYEPTNALRITNQNTGIFDRLTEGENFILVEELQSDLISGGFRKFKRIPYTVEKTKKVVDATIFNAKDLFPEASTYLKSYSDDLSKDITEFFDQLDNTPPQETGKYLPNNPYEGIPDPEEVSIKLANKYTERIQKDVADGKISFAEGDDAQELLAQIITYVQEPGSFASESKYILGNKYIAQQRATNKDARRDPKRFGSPPIKKNIESVELNIQTLINQANDMGIDKIVFPSFDMIAAMRFKGDSLKAAINNKSIKRDLQGDPMYDNDGNPVLTDGNALYRNYVTDFNKALNKFKTEYPEIKIETGVELPYKPYAGFEDLRTDGVVIDISEMKKVYDLSKPKFSGGGLVREQ